MGARCSRRKRTGGIDPPDLLREADEGWLIIQQTRNLRFRKAVKRVMSLLIVRKLWSQVGRWLNSEANKGHVRRQALVSFWSLTCKTTIKRYKPLFDQVHRRRGSLEYRQ